MATDLIRSLAGNGNSDREFGLWREVDRIMDSLARTFGRESDAPQTKGFARDALAQKPILDMEPDEDEDEEDSVRRIDYRLNHEADEDDEDAEEEVIMATLQSDADNGSKSRATHIRVIDQSANNANPSAMSPVTDAFEDDDNFELMVELPGVQPNEIDIEFSSGQVTISAEKRGNGNGKEKKRHIRERAFGTYKRSFAIPFQANPDIIEASIADGVITVTVPRPPETKPRVKKISLKAS